MEITKFHLGILLQDLFGRVYEQYDVISRDYLELVSMLFMIS